MFIVAIAAISIHILVIAFLICWNNICVLCYKSKHCKSENKFSIEFFPYDKTENKYSNQSIKKIKVRDIKNKMEKGGLKLFSDLSADAIKSGISIIANIATTLSGIATFIMLLIALFGKRIKKFLHGPKLVLSFKPEFPYCNRTFYIPTKEQTFSLKFKISNNGEMDARNVQLYLNGIYKISENGEYIKSKNVFPMNLMWSFQDRVNEETPIASVISPDMDKFCDFLFIDRYHCYLRTEVSVPVGNTLCNTIEKGSYKAVIHIMSSESKSIKYNIFFNYTGKWSKKIKKVIQNVRCIRE